jgi:hypothetical protein
MDLSDRGFLDPERRRSCRLRDHCRNEACPGDDQGARVPHGPLIHARDSRSDDRGWRSVPSDPPEGGSDESSRADYLILT